MIDNIVREYFSKKAILEQAEIEFEKVEESLEPHIYKILGLYSKKETQINNELGRKYRSVYDSHIKFDKFDKFSIEEETENYLLVSCNYVDRDNEFFITNIKVPKDLDKIDLFVEEFGEEIKNEILNKREKEKSREKEKRQEMFLKLKEEFE